MRYTAICVIIIITVANSNAQTSTSTPTPYPTQSPVVCTYLPYKGNDNANASNKELNVTNLINYVKLKDNATLIQANTTAKYLNQNITCNNTNGCLIECSDTAACYQANVICDSDTGCNIKCQAGFTCGKMSIFAQRETNSPQTLNTAMTIVCHKDACQEMNVYIRDIASAHIHCLEPDSCTWLTVIIEDISSKNNNNTSINCYTENACTNLNVIADGLLTQLNMYQYSSGVLLNNNFGYLPEYETVTCNIDNYYVEFPFNKNKNIKDEVRNQYTFSTLPCEDLTIQCLDKNGLDATCSMDYTFLLDTQNIEKLQESSHDNYTCVNLALKDIVDLSCVGTCVTSPTNPPTNTPSVSPTQPPTLAPTLTPIAPPTVTPSFSPSVNPTFSPSIAPITPTSNPTTAPTIAPTDVPTSAPTYSPTSAPTRLPTGRGIDYNYKIDIIYIFWNLNVDNYDFIFHYSDNTVIEHMEEIIESNYFDRQLLPEFKLFNIQINKINQIYLSRKRKLTHDILYNNLNKNGDRIMFVKAKILLFEAYISYFIATSRYFRFENSTTYSFREYFNNPALKFTVANASTLTWESIHRVDSKIDTTLIIIVVTFLCFIISFCIYWGHKIYIKKIRIPNNRKQRSIQKEGKGEFVEVKNTVIENNEGENEGNENNDKNYTVIGDVFSYAQKHLGDIDGNDGFDGDQVEMINMGEDHQ